MAVALAHVGSCASEEDNESDYVDSTFKWIVKGESCFDTRACLE